MVGLIDLRCVLILLNSTPLKAAIADSYFVGRVRVHPAEIGLEEY